MKMADLNELQCSLYFHQNFIPFLISSKLLREVGAGQIDIAYLVQAKPWRAFIIEVKNATDPSPTQWRRLRKTQDYLSKVLEFEIILKVKFCQKDIDSLS